MEEKLYTVNEICAYFKISRTTLYFWRKSKIVEPIKVGKSLRFRESDIAKVLKDLK